MIIDKKERSVSLFVAIDSADRVMQQMVALADRETPHHWKNVHWKKECSLQRDVSNAYSSDKATKIVCQQ